MKVGPSPRARAVEGLVDRHVHRQGVVAVHLDARACRRRCPSGPGSRCGSGSLRGMEMAHWLFWQMKTTGACQTAAKFRPSWKSPSLVPPSPMKATATSPVALVLGGVGQARRVHDLAADHHAGRQDAQILRRAGCCPPPSRCSSRGWRSGARRAPGGRPARGRRPRTSRRPAWPWPRRMEMASWPVQGGKVPRRPWRCSLSMRSSSSRARRIQRYISTARSGPRSGSSLASTLPFSSRICRCWTENFAICFLGIAAVLWLGSRRV